MVKSLIKKICDTDDIGYILIDPPVTPYSSEEDILSWIQELKSHPNLGRPEIKEALEQAQEMLEWRREYKQ